MDAAEKPRRFELGPGQTWRAFLPAIIMASLAFAPALNERGGTQQHTWIAAGLAIVATLFVLSKVRGRGETPTIEVQIRRPHYMQAITQAGVYICWATAWEPVANYGWHLAIQIALAYQVDMLFAWWKGKRWQLGFGPLPIVGSINLFMWFKDEFFAWQLVLVALSYAGKWLITWEREGRRRHIFNPSSFGLGGVSILLLVLGASDATWGREIAVTQEDPTYIFQVLFGVSLIVQLQFPVVLITASAVVSTWLFGAVWLKVTGVYIFGTTDIPAAVFLGTLLLVTDPATSPTGRRAKILFGMAYGVLAAMLYPVLESFGDFGYYDKLLPVPILNLLVPAFDRWGARLRGEDGDRESAPPPSTGENIKHVSVWALIFIALMSTNAVGPNHPGRQVEFWQEACEADRLGACKQSFRMLRAACDEGQAPGCHNVGAILFERVQTGEERERERSAEYFDRACKLGLSQSCAVRDVVLEKSPAPAETGTKPPPTATPAAPPAPVQDPVAAATLACEEKKDAEACVALYKLYTRGTQVLGPDPVKARNYLVASCDHGAILGCNTLASEAMQKPGGADLATARIAFEGGCALDDSKSCINLALMKFKGEGVERDQAAAASLLEKACDLEDAIGCFRAGEIQRTGTGVPVDQAKFEMLTRKACQLGEQRACNLLSQLGLAAPP